MAFMVVLWASRRVLQRPLSRPRKPHGALSTVSQCHGMTNIARVTQHDMPLHILFQSKQVCQQQIMGAHYVAYFQHNSLELLIVPSHRGTLLQVKQAGLVTQGMVQIPEFSFQGVAEILPRTNA